VVERQRSERKKGKDEERKGKEENKEEDNRVG
jgi:hypothetical protein